MYQMVWVITTRSMQTTLLALVLVTFGYYFSKLLGNVSYKIAFDLTALFTTLVLVAVLSALFPEL